MTDDSIAHNSMADELTDKLDIVINSGTDSATWYLYHPESLAHRNQDPFGWWGEDFAVCSEFAAGRLIAVSIGGDGGFSVRITNRGLSDREQTYARQCAEFRLRVQHKRLYLDGGYALPSAETYQFDVEHCYANEQNWITLPNGNYRAIVHEIAWNQEPGAVDENGNATPAALANYVVDLQPVKNLEAVSFPTTIPSLFTHSILSTASDDESENFDDDESENSYLPEDEGDRWRCYDRISPPKTQYPLLRCSEIIYPMTQPKINLSQHDEPITLWNWETVICRSIDEDTIGICFYVQGFTDCDVSEEEQPEEEQPDGILIRADRICAAEKASRMRELVQMDDVQIADGAEYFKAAPTLYGTALQMVRLKRVFQKGAVWWSEVEPWEIPASLVSPEAIDRLKQQFADYAAANFDYQNRIEFPRFFAERVASLTHPRVLGRYVAEGINLSLEEQFALLPRSDVELIEALNRALEARLSE